MYSHVNIRPLWQLLLLTRNRQKPIRLTCEECFALLEFDAELLESGNDIENICPAARHHLSLCRGCQAKFGRWMRNSPSWAETTSITDSHEKVPCQKTIPTKIIILQESET